MSETLTDTAQEPVSTQLEPDTDSVNVGGGSEPQDAPEPEKPKEPEAPKTRREAIEAAAEKLEKKEPGNESPEGDRPQENVKPKVDENKNNPEATVETKDRAPSDTRQPSGDEQKEPSPDAPKRFLPKAKDKWQNTPSAVKAEVVRLQRDYDAALQRNSENHQYRAALKPFEDYARQNKIELSQALQVYTDIDKLLKQNPVQAVGDILQRIGMRPDQYAQLVLQNSPEYQARMMMPRAQKQPEQEQEAPEVRQLRDQLANEQAARVNAEVIAPFAAAHPRFQELQETIVQFLNSDMIPKDLAPTERLETAYDMAARINPPSQSNTGSTSVPQDSAQTSERRAGKSPQISGAPSSGQSQNPVRRGKMSRRASIEAAIDRMGA